MIVTYYGKQFFKIQLGERTIAYNPIGKDSKEKGSRFGADIILSSINHVDFNGIEQCSYGEKQPFVLTGPGEYEVDGIFIKGFGSEIMYGGVRKVNTIYSVMFEGINLCFLGSLGSSQLLSGEIKEGLGEIDVLFTPICGGDMLSASDSYKLALMLNVKVVIPMEFGESKTTLPTFIKESGENSQTVDKFSFKRKDLEGKEAFVVVLKIFN